jgi:hypothetical protein
MSAFMKYSYNENVPLHLQVWLATDHYKKSNNPKEISATALLKPVKSSVLSFRAKAQIDQAISLGETGLLEKLNRPELSGLLKSRLGTALHDSVKRAWVGNYKQALTDLGYSEAYIDRIVLNPETEQGLPQDAIVVYTEVRKYRNLDNHTISGELDFVFDKIIQDLKSTTGYAFKFADEEKHNMQMSIYKWIFKGNGIHLNDIAQVNYLFTDWNPTQAASNPAYPQSNTAGVTVALQDDTQVENFIRNKIQLFEEFQDAPEDVLPPCLPEELWQAESTWAYYSSADKIGGRAGKVSTEYAEIAAHYNSKGSGVVIERPGKIKFCNFCAGSDICKQKDAYIASGLLEYKK